MSLRAVPFIHVFYGPVGDGKPVRTCVYRDGADEDATAATRSCRADVKAMAAATE